MTGARSQIPSAILLCMTFNISISTESTTWKATLEKNTTGPVPHDKMTAVRINVSAPDTASNIDEVTFSITVTSNNNSNETYNISDELHIFIRIINSIDDDKDT